jgi:hypothetical protein
MITLNPQDAKGARKFRRQLSVLVEEIEIFQ